tara:strand:- start:403 stop:1323 length:921 start_codon:yes stop_codon:yes gene_type:complete
MMRPAGLTYEVYKSQCNAKGLRALSKAAFESLPESEDKDDKDEEEEEEDEEEEEEDSDKSETSGGVDPDALEKALADYEAVENGLDLSGDTGDRETYLTARLDAGTISKSERQELGRIWSGDYADYDNDDDTVSKSLEDGIREDDDSGDLLDASLFLKSMVDGIEDRLSGVEGEVRGSRTATMELVKAQGGLIKAMAGEIKRQSRINGALEERLGIVEKSPAPRRSVGADPRDVRSRELGKAKVGGDADDTLSKSQIFTGLRSLMQKADNDRARDQLAHATAKFESTGHLSRGLLNLVTTELSEAN